MSEEIDKIIDEIQEEFSPEFLLKYPNSFLNPEELSKVRPIMEDVALKFDGEYIPLIIQKIDKTIEEYRKPVDERKEHHIIIEDGKYSTDLCLTINELHQIDHWIEDYIYHKIMEPEYVKWQKIRAKILHEILRRFEVKSV